jgi:hypothetical protein
MPNNKWERLDVFLSGLLIFYQGVGGNDACLQAEHFSQLIEHERDGHE